MESIYENTVPFKAKYFLSGAELKAKSKDKIFSIPSINNIIGIVYGINDNIGVILEKRSSIYYEKSGTVYNYNDMVIFANLTEETQDMPPLIIKRDKYSRSDLDDGAIVLSINNSWYLWSEIYVYKISSEDLTFSTHQMFSSDGNDNEMINLNLKHNATHAFFQNSYHVFNDNAFISNSYANRKWHTKNISIRLKSN